MLWIKKALLIFGASFLLASCARHYENTAKRAWDLLEQGRTDRALELYEKQVTGKNEQLLRLLDEGLILRSAGQFAESNERFLEAARIIDRAGYISISEQAVTLLTNERHQFYQGEDFEKVLVHVFLALNFISLEQWESALVEARRVNEILVRFMTEAERPYKQNAFARYLMGVIFEKDREFNDAFIAYRNVWEIEASLADRFEALPVDLIRMARAVGFVEEEERFAELFGEEVLSEARRSWREREASVILLFESGKAPEKYSTRERHKATQKDGTVVDILVPLPQYKRRPSVVRSARLNWVSGEESVQSRVLESIEATAKRHLEDRMGRVVAKAIAQAAVKAGIATGVGIAADSQELGLLTGLLLFAMSEADTRSWLLLPGELQVARIYLPAGTHELSLEYLDQWGRVVDNEESFEIYLQPSEIHFLQRRRFD